MQYDNNNKERWKKDSGKSGKHKNMNAKEAVKEKWLKAKERLKQLQNQKHKKETVKEIQFGVKPDDVCIFTMPKKVWLLFAMNVRIKDEFLIHI